MLPPHHDDAHEFHAVDRIGTIITEAGREHDGVVDIPAVEALVRDARVLLKPFAKATNWPARLKALGAPSVGGNEGISFLIQLAELDRDGNGKLNPEEMDIFKVKVEKLYDVHLNTFLNAGVVVALILSIIFSIPIDNPLVVNWDGSHEYTKEREFALRLTAYCCVNVAICLGASTLVATSLMYSQLAFWMPNLMMQIWYMGKIRPLMPLVEVGKNCCVLFSGGYLLFQSLAEAAWLGVVASLPLLGPALVLLYFLFFLKYSIDLRLQEDSRRLVGGRATNTRASAEAEDSLRARLVQEGSRRHTVN